MFIDLSVLLNEHTPVYPGDPATKIAPAGVLGRDGYCDHYVSVGTHVGTHIDAPMHMLEEGSSIDKRAVDQLIGHGVVVDVSGGYDLAAVQAANIQAGDVVLFYTRMASKYHDLVYFEEYPVMSEDIAQYLLDKKVKLVGMDACSVDGREGFPIHKILLSGNIFIIENLTNLDQLLGKKFRVFALPIKLEADGAPARVIAEITN